MLSGAICGWSGSMIAAPSTASSACVASTGQELTFSQPWTSSGEMKRPPATRPTTCVESSECCSAAARSSPGGTSVVLCTEIVMRTRRSWSGIAVMIACPCSPS